MATPLNPNYSLPPSQQPTTDEAIPPSAPAGFQVTKLGGSTFKVQWRDSPTQLWYRGLRNFHQSFPSTWELRHVPIGVVGPAGAYAAGTFAGICLSESTIITTFPARHDNALIEVVLNDITIQQDYILVVGRTSNGDFGYPTEPQRLDNSSSGFSGEGGTIRNPAISLANVTGPNGESLVAVTAAYDAPTAQTFKNFGGVALIATGYQGDALFRELGGFLPYPYIDDHQYGRRVTSSFDLPRDTNATTVYFVNVGRDGIKTDDPTTKPSVVFAGGLHG